MPIAMNGAVRIHFELEGCGPPLVLHHGSVSSLDVWRRFGYVDALRAHFQCILIDARGRGASDKPMNPEAYVLRRYAEDVSAVLNALGLPSAHFWGYSMGGWVGFGMAAYAPERIQRLVIGGAHPYEDQSNLVFNGVDGSDPDAFIAALEMALGESIAPDRRPSLLAHDLRLIATSMQVRPSLVEYLPSMKLPCLLYAGDADRRHAAIKTCSEQLANAQFISIPSRNHSQVTGASESITPQVMKFLDGS